MVILSYLGLRNSLLSGYDAGLLSMMSFGEVQGVLIFLPDDCLLIQYWTDYE